MNTAKLTGAALLVSAAMIGTAFAQAPGSPQAGASGSSTIDRTFSGQTPAGGSAGRAQPMMPAPQASAPQARGSADRGPRVDAAPRGDRSASNQWRGRDGNWRNDGDRRWRDRNWRGGPAVSFGFGFGPSYGYYGDSYAYYGGPSYGGTTYYSGPSGDDVAYCSQRYRSYDPALGTYLGYDGMRHPCP